MLHLRARAAVRSAVLTSGPCIKCALVNVLYAFLDRIPSRRRSHRTWVTQTFSRQDRTNHGLLLLYVLSMHRGPGRTNQYLQPVLHFVRNNGARVQVSDQTPEQVQASIEKVAAEAISEVLDGNGLRYSLAQRGTGNRTTPAFDPGAQSPARWHFACALALLAQDANRGKRRAESACLPLLSCAQQPIAYHAPL